MTPAEHRACELQAKRVTYWRGMRDVCRSIRHARRDGFDNAEWYAARRQTLAAFRAEWRFAFEAMRDERRNAA